MVNRRGFERRNLSRPLNRAEAGSEIFFGTHSRWGLGMAVDMRRNEIFHTSGRFGWTGGFGTTAYIDHAKEMVGILFTDFWTLASRPCPFSMLLASQKSIEGADVPANILAPE